MRYNKIYSLTFLLNSMCNFHEILSLVTKWNSKHSSTRLDGSDLGSKAWWLGFWLGDLHLGLNLAHEDKIKIYIPQYFKKKNFEFEIRNLNFFLNICKQKKIKMQTIAKLKDYNFFSSLVTASFLNFFLNFQILIYIFFNLLCKTQLGHGSGQANLGSNHGSEIRLGLMWLA